MVKRLSVLVIGLLTLGALYAAARKSAQPVGPDKGQIRAALAEAIDALNQGRVSTAMNVVSPDYKDSTGFSRDRLWLLARRAADNRADWSASLGRVKSQVEGDTAGVDITLRVAVADHNQLRDYPISLTMKREDTRVWLVIPTRQWHIVASTGLPEDMLELGD